MTSYQRAADLLYHHLQTRPSVGNSHFTRWLAINVQQTCFTTACKQQDPEPVTATPVTGKSKLWWFHLNYNLTQSGDSIWWSRIGFAHDAAERSDRDLGVWRFVIRGLSEICDMTAKIWDFMPEDLVFGIWDLTRDFLNTVYYNAINCKSEALVQIPALWAVRDPSGWSENASLHEKCTGRRHCAAASLQSTRRPAFPRDRRRTGRRCTDTEHTSGGWSQVYQQRLLAGRQHAASL